MQSVLPAVTHGSGWLVPEVEVEAQNSAGSSFEIYSNWRSAMFGMIGTALVVVSFPSARISETPSVSVVKVRVFDPSSSLLTVKILK